MPRSLSVSRPGAGMRPMFVVGASMLLFLAAALACALRIDVGHGFDELAHLSYVAQVQEAHDAAVPLETLRLLDPATWAFTGQANYLNHPPFYYQLMAAIGPRLVGDPAAVVVLHLVNVAMVGGALALMLAMGIRLAPSRAAIPALALNLCCIRFLMQLAGSVNNDNLAMLGGAILLFGAGRYLASGKLSDLLLASIGLIVGGMAKLTGLMLCGAFLALLLALLGRTRGRVAPTHLLVALAAMAVAALPFVPLWIDYGSPAPDTSAQQQLLRQGAAMTGWAGEERLPLPAYILMFLRSFVEGWMPVLTERSGVQQAALLLPLGTLGLALIGVVQAGWTVVVRRSREALPIIIVAGAGAIMATMAIHVGFSYRRHLATGWMMDAYPRYYLPMLPIVPLAALSCVHSLPDGRVKTGVTGFLTLSPLLFAMLG